MQILKVASEEQGEGSVLCGNGARCSADLRNVLFKHKTAFIPILMTASCSSFIRPMKGDDIKLSDFVLTFCILVIIGRYYPQKLTMGERKAVVFNKNSGREKKSAG